MGVDDIEEGFDPVMESTIENLRDDNERIQAANEFYRVGQPLAGPGFWTVLERANAHYRTATAILENPLYDESEEELEAVYRFEELMETVEEYLLLGFEPEDY